MRRDGERKPIPVSEMTDDYLLKALRDTMENIRSTAETLEDISTNIEVGGGEEDSDSYIQEDISMLEKLEDYYVKAADILRAEVTRRGLVELRLRKKVD